MSDNFDFRLNIELLGYKYRTIQMILNILSKKYSDNSGFWIILLSIVFLKHLLFKTNYT